jgi:regulator of RNase E activity RraA
MSDLDALAALDTCAVSDALDNLGLLGAAVGLRPLWPCTSVVVGRARTVQAGQRTPDAPGTHIASPAVADAVPGDFIVIANDGRLDVSCWGGILTHGALAKGVAGVVIDGACRDIAESEGLGLPVYGRAVVPVSARGRVVQLAMDVSVSVADVVVRPGDLVIGDACGVVFVPSARAAEVIEQAQVITKREARMVASVEAGRSIIETMSDSQFANTAIEVTE